MLYVGNDWAEDHHDVELVDETGRRVARARLPEGLAGITRLHGLIAAHMPAEWVDLDPGEAAAKVRVGIETDRGPWVQALVAAGYQVYPINPAQVARYRQRHSTSGAKSDPADAHVLAEIVRLDHAHHRPIAGDSSDAEAVKLVAREHQSLIWDRTRQLLRLRSALREFLPGRAGSLRRPGRTRRVGTCSAAPPDPHRAAALSRAQIAVVLRRAGRRDVDAKSALPMRSDLRLLREPVRRPRPLAEAEVASIVSGCTRLRDRVLVTVLMRPGCVSGRRCPAS